MADLIIEPPEFIDVPSEPPPTLEGIMQLSVPPPAPEGLIQFYEPVEVPTIVYPATGVRPYDEGCTGFPDKIGSKDFTKCCLEHDLGGSDGTLLDCLKGEAPGWDALFCLALFFVALLRPFYNWLQDRGWAQ